MSTIALSSSPTAQDVAFDNRLKKRHRRERTFRRLGLGSIIAALLVLAFLLWTIISQGYDAFFRSEAMVPATQELTQNANSRQAKVEALAITIKGATGNVPTRAEKRQLAKLYSPLLQESIATTDNAYQYVMASTVSSALIGEGVKLTPYQLSAIEILQQNEQLERAFNPTFFTSADSREPEAAGILGALVGSLLTLAVTFTLAFPIGVGAAIYLEEFSRPSRWRTIIEVNINNLAAVPSIVFGLLGLAVFIQFFGLPRSAPLVGGCVLALMTLPTIIIATRAALKAVPGSIRQAARGLGATEVQTVFHHVVPCGMPGIITGSIIGMAQALGETAPLLLIGMVAFIADIPGGFTDAATVLPVQIFIWSDSPERAFAAKTAGAIMVLLGVLLCMNLLAAWLRTKLEKKW